MATEPQPYVNIGDDLERALNGANLHLCGSKLIWRHNARWWPLRGRAVADAYDEPFPQPAPVDQHSEKKLYGYVDCTVREDNESVIITEFCRLRVYENYTISGIAGADAGHLDLVVVLNDIAPAILAPYPTPPNHAVGCRRVLGLVSAAVHALNTFQVPDDVLARHARDLEYGRQLRKMMENDLDVKLGVIPD